MPPAPERQGPRCYCGAEKDLRLYAGGWRCPSHTPSALAGQAEPGQDRYCAPARCYCGGCESYGKRMVCLDFGGTVVDLRAVASGKCRAPWHEYRAAQTALAALR